MSNKRKARPRQQQQTARGYEGSVVVAYVHPVELSALFMESYDRMRTYDGARGRHIVGVLRQPSSANISNARNSLTGKFLEESKAEWLLWLDADMTFDPDLVERLLGYAHPTEAPIVGGLCFGIADGKAFPTLYDLRENGQGGVQMWRFDAYPADALMRVTATGAACLLIHRDVLEAMRVAEFNKVYPFFQETELNGYPCGEDVTFCLRAGLLGAPVHVATGVKLGHAKVVVIDEEFYADQVGDPHTLAPGPSQPGAGGTRTE